VDRRIRLERRRNSSIPPVALRGRPGITCGANVVRTAAAHQEARPCIISYRCISLNMSHIGRARLPPSRGGSNGRRFRRGEAHWPSAGPGTRTSRPHAGPSRPHPADIPRLTWVSGELLEPGIRRMWLKSIWALSGARPSVGCPSFGGTCVRRDALLQVPNHCRDRNLDRSEGTSVANLLRSHGVPGLVPQFEPIESGPNLGKKRAVRS